jgi:hypothetical protein
MPHELAQRDALAPQQRRQDQGLDRHGRQHDRAACGTDIGETGAEQPAEQAELQYADGNQRRQVARLYARQPGARQRQPQQKDREQTQIAHQADRRRPSLLGEQTRRHRARSAEGRADGGREHRQLRGEAHARPLDASAGDGARPAGAWRVASGA